MAFPYYSTFLPSPEVLFASLRELCSRQPDVGIGPYQLYSYYPVQETAELLYFRGESLTVGGRNEQLDHLADLFNEHIRLSARKRVKGLMQEQSIMQRWDSDQSFRDQVTASGTPSQQRQAVFQMVDEVTGFSPGWAINLLKVVTGLDSNQGPWLDMSSGWGDRLMAAMALDLEYQGYDPHLALEPSYQDMIARLGTPGKQKIDMIPFQEAEPARDYYNVCLISPPYFNLEQYSSDVTQSDISYPQLEDWLHQFLYPCLDKLVDCLRPAGYLILHLGDTAQMRLCSGARQHLDATGKLVYDGVIGVRGTQGHARPVWVWQRQ